ncbi:MAG: hypothetical protein ACE5IQ_13775 [Candidatus Methylomirabilales bacterium]
MKCLRKTVRHISVYSFLLILFIAVAVSAPSQAQGGVEAGDFVKYSLEYTGYPSGIPLPTSMEIEFLSVSGTEATVRMTVHSSDGTKLTEEMTLDLAVGGGSLGGVVGFVIPVGRTTGDSVFMSGVGDVTIEGETTRTYAGASRTVVFAGIMGLTYYWDKQTGVLVEVSGVTGGLTVSAKATETNMWGAAPFFVQWWFLAIVAGVIIALAGTVYFLRRRRPHQ